MTSFAIQSFGCRVNQAEAFSWAEEFQKHGFRFEEDFTNSDLIIVNTCTVTGRADRDARNFIRKVPRINPNARIVVTGCFADRAGNELQKYPQIWKILSNREKPEILREILSELKAGKENTHKSYRSRAFIKIQDGCDFHCTFCIVPSVRGKSLSISPKNILDRVRESIRNGYQEIVLTGVHLCLYGRDLPEDKSFVNLLQRIEDLEDLKRIRLGSLDPRFMENQLVQYLIESHKICDHFHFSLQYGSDRIIKRMGRKINVKDYVNILKDFRDGRPDAALGADMIVGFPGETDSDFEQTINFVQNSPLDYLHVFSYSPRPGTPAAEWPEVKSETKKSRAVRLRKVSAQKWQDFRLRFLGQECEGVVIEKSPDDARVLTSNYIEVSVPGLDAKVKEIVRIKINQLKGLETLLDLSENKLDHS